MHFFKFKSTYNGESDNSWAWWLVLMFSALMALICYMGYLCHEDKTKADVCGSHGGRYAHGIGCLDAKLFKD